MEWLEATNIYKTVSMFSPLSVIQYFSIPDMMSGNFEMAREQSMSMKYRLLQYTKTTLHKSIKDADMPVVRPMFFNFPSDTDSYAFTH